MSWCIIICHETLCRPIIDQTAAPQRARKAGSMPQAHVTKRNRSQRSSGSRAAAHASLSRVMPRPLLGTLCRPIIDQPAAPQRARKSGSMPQAHVTKRNRSQRSSGSRAAAAGLVKQRFVAGPLASTSITHTNLIAHIDPMATCRHGVSVDMHA